MKVKTFHKYYGQHSAGALQLFNLPELRKITDIVDRNKWEKKCLQSANMNNRIQLVEHSCQRGSPIGSQWSFLPRTFFDNASGILHMAEPEHGAGGMAAAAAWRRKNEPNATFYLDEQFENLQASQAKLLLDFGSLFASSLFSNSFKSVFEFQGGLFGKTTSSFHSMITGGLIYRPELWKGACKLSRRISPYIANHLRGGDGPFMKGNRPLSSEMQEAKMVKDLLLSGTKKLESLGRWKSDPKCSASATWNSSAPAVRMLVTSDLTYSEFMTKVETEDAFQTFSEDAGNIVDRHGGWKWNVAFMKGINVKNARLEIRSKPYFKNFPRGFEALILDVMMGSLADLGFVGNPDSTLSNHIYQIRENFARDDLCKVHDRTDVDDGCTPGCPSTEQSGMDINRLAFNFDPHASNQSHHAPVEADSYFEEALPYVRPSTCPAWCLSNVAKKKIPIKHVCNLAECKTCIFPGTEKSCSFGDATPPSPTPAGTCKGWCSTDFDKGKSKNTLCGYAGCTGCIFSDNSSCSGRRARWVQSCEQMNAIECMKAIVDGQCRLQNDGDGRQCTEDNKG